MTGTAQMRRMLEADHSQIAAEIARRSRPDLGPDSLAKTQGYRNPTALIAATTGTTNGEAARLVQVGEATAPRQLLSGETAPARHPHIAAAMAAARIGASAGGGDHRDARPGRVAGRVARGSKRRSGPSPSRRPG